MEKKKAVAQRKIADLEESVESLHEMIVREQEKVASAWLLFVYSMGN